MYNGEDAAKRSEPKERRKFGRIPDSLFKALHPLLHQYNVIPLQLCLHCAIPEAHHHNVVQQLQMLSGLEVIPHIQVREEIIAQLIEPMSNPTQSNCLFKSKALWEELNREQRLALMRTHLREVKLKLTPLAQGLRCYPAGLALQVNMNNWENEAVLDHICEVTGWDIYPAQPSLGPHSNHAAPTQVLHWKTLLCPEDYLKLKPILRAYQIEPLAMHILLAMADPSDWHTCQQIEKTTGLSVHPFLAEETEITAALREKIGSAQEDLWRQTAILPIFFKLDRLLPLLANYEILPLNLSLRIGINHIQDHLTCHQIHLLTGYPVTPVEMSEQAMARILGRITRQIR